MSALRCLLLRHQFQSMHTCLEAIFARFDLFVFVSQHVNPEHEDIVSVVVAIFRPPCNRRVDLTSVQGNRKRFNSKYLTWSRK